jgi:hypothetical protein
MKEGQLYNTILMSLFMVYDYQLYIIELCQIVAKALDHGFILSKSSFCGQDIKYLSLLNINELVGAKGTLRISYHFDTKKEDIDALILYISDNAANPDPQMGALPLDELSVPVPEPSAPEPEPPVQEF